MPKSFFEVFPVLQVSGEMKQMLSDMEVPRVVSNKERTHLRIYLNGSRLIQKKNIRNLEQNIKKQLFPQQELTVKIIEHYQLSAQYTPQTLMDIYKDSILEELKSYSLLLYNLFRCARMEFDEKDHMKLYMEDSIVAQNRSEELLEILYKIMRDRCGLSLTIEPVFEPKKESSRKKESDMQISLEIRQILNGIDKGVISDDDLTEGGMQPENDADRNAADGTSFGTSASAKNGSVKENASGGMVSDDRALSQTNADTLPKGLSGDSGKTAEKNALDRKSVV